MLNEVFPRRSTRYVALPLLGPFADDFDTWLSAQGYRRATRRQQAHAVARIDRDLRRRGHRPGQTLSLADLEACSLRYRQRDPKAAATVRALRRFLQARGLITVAPAAVTRAATLAKSYGIALHDLRGLALATVQQHVATAEQFLIHLDYEVRPKGLATLTAADVEAFIHGAGERLSRPTLQHRVAQLRGFLRFLASHGIIRPGLDSQIDTPRVYRQEQLPHSLPWPTVQQLLRSIDRRTPRSLRDYTMLFLIATYGLRACEVVALRPADVDLGGGKVRVPGRRDRTVPIGARGIRMITPWVSERRQGTYPWLFPGPDEDHHAALTLPRQVVRRLAEQAFPQRPSIQRRINAVGFRDLFLMRALARRASLSFIAETLGVDRLTTAIRHLPLAHRSAHDELERIRRPWKKAWI
jgi:site-specific recombinase XerD